MRKILLFVALATFSLSTFGQKVWNLGGDPTIGNAWTTSNGIGNGDGSAGNPAFPVTIDGLSITGISSNVNMGAVTSSAKSFTDADGKTYDFVNRFQFNGGGYSGASVNDETPTVMMPTQRFVSFDVAGDAEIYMIGITGSSSATRRLFVTDGTKLIGSVVFNAGSVAYDGKINYVGPATTLYLFCNQACNLMLLSTTNYATTSTNTIDANKTIVSEKFYNLLGHEIPSNSKGLVIRKVTYDDGTTSSLKTYVRWEK